MLEGSAPEHQIGQKAVLPSLAQLTPLRVVELLGRKSRSLQILTAPS
jgi:hypothetical protein